MNANTTGTAPSFSIIYRARDRLSATCCRDERLFSGDEWPGTSSAGPGRILCRTDHCPCLSLNPDDPATSPEASSGGPGAVSLRRRGTPWAAVPSLPTDSFRKRRFGVAPDCCVFRRCIEHQPGAQGLERGLSAGCAQGTEQHRLCFRQMRKPAFGVSQRFTGSPTRELGRPCSAARAAACRPLPPRQACARRRAGRGGAHP